MLFRIKKIFKNIFNAQKEGREPDYFLIITVFIIIFFGLIMLSSATSATAYADWHDSYYYFKHQLIFGLLPGILLFFALSRIDYHIWRKYALLMLITSVVLLLLVFIPGLSAEYGKARSWINIFGFSLQPSEFVKISFLLYLAAWLESRKERVKDIKEGIGPFLVVLGIIAGLMFLQPDIGTFSIITFTSLVIFFVGGGRLRHLAVILLIGSALLFFVVKTKPHVGERFKCFYDSGFSQNAKCYQINQSLIALGSGGFWGRGLGESRQKFMYVPEIEGDSIFAIIGEEMGFIFSSALVFMYLIIFYRGFLIAAKAPDVYGKILAIGIVTWLSSQALINIGGMINLIPMTGVPLPFVSYGGSALLSALGAVGILVNISRQTRNL
jgi:cell division protein FtsW